jgi:hypothetical protein
MQGHATTNMLTYMRSPSFAQTKEYIMKSRLFVVAIVLAFVVTSLGVNVRPAAAAGNVTATCNSLSVNGTTLPVFLVSVIVASHPSILFPLIIADATGAYSASVSISLPAGTVVSGYIVDFIAVPFSVTVPPCSASTGSGNPPWNPMMLASMGVLVTGSPCTATRTRRAQTRIRLACTVS